MKLKKIASLMLAGVMAVSMLAGCSNNGNDKDPSTPETPVVSSASTKLYNDLSADTRLSITSATANSTLESALASSTTKNWNSNDYKYCLMRLARTMLLPMCTTSATIFRCTKMLPML